MSGSAELPGGIPPRYKIEKELGRGGMGRVVAAFDTTIRRRVAIKIAPAPPPGDIEQQKAFERFRREAQLAGGLRHENIVGIYDFGADAQSAWMVMEIVEGGSLRELLQRTEAFSLAETARIMVQLLDGLAFCHDQGIVHCDVKPANIMLTEPTTAGEVKLTDFGIASNFGPGLSATDDSGGDDGEATRVFSTPPAAPSEPERIGTPSHMAPEQFTGGPLDQRTDIWAAGVVLYHLLTRENPFKGDADTIEMKVLSTEPTPPSQLSVLATRPFDDLIRKALAKRPQDRFQDARGFAAALLEATRARRSGATAALPKPAIPEPPPPSKSASPAWVKYAAAGGGAAVLAGLAALLLMPGTPPPAPSPAPLAQLVQPTPDAARPAPVQPAVTPPPAQLAAPAPSPPLAAPPQILLVPAQPPATPSQVTQSQPAPAPVLPAPAAVPPAQSTVTQAAPTQAAPARVTPAPAAPAPPAQASPSQPSPAPVASAPALTPAPPALAPLTPAPLTPALPAPPSEAAIQTALASVVDAQRCALLDVRREGNVVTLAGFVHHAEVTGLQQRLQSVGLTPRMQAEIFDAPFCDLLALLRPAMAAPGAPRVSARSNQIRAGERLTLDFETANWPTTVNLWFVMHDGQTLRLLGDQRLAAGERRMMNETSPDFPWVIAEPFGHEMIIMLASDGPPFPTPRPLEETIDSLTGAIREAMGRARAEGRRLVARAIMVHTRP